MLLALLAVCLSGFTLAACGAGSTGNPARHEAGGQTARKRAASHRAARHRRAREREARRQARQRERQAVRRQRARERRTARAGRRDERRIRIKARALARNGGDVDCGDLPDQATAQLYLLSGDPFNLDGDGDGVACASLPCPCSELSGRSGENPGAGPVGGPPSRFRGPVVSVSDGDTLSVRSPSGTVEKIRMIGIDTPEVYGGVECGGRAASAAMKRLARGTVTVTADPTQDRRDHYGRLLAYIDKGRRDLGLVMVRRGLASAYPYDGPFRRYGAYYRAEQRARAAGTGSWKHCDISPPG